MTALAWGAVPLAWALAQAVPPTTPNWVQPLATYGPLGIFMAAAMWFFKQAYDKQVAEKEEERRYSRDLETSVRLQVIPLLTQVQASTVDAVKVMNQLGAEMAVRDRMRGRTLDK